MTDNDSPGHEPANNHGASAPGGPACQCWPAGEHAGQRWVSEQVPADPNAVRLLRQRMRAWVEDVDLETDLAESVVLLVDEAVTNAVEHACPDTDCHVTLIAGPRACGGGVAVLVTDNGLWQEITAPGYRGRGIALMGELSEPSNIEATSNGTAVRLCWANPPRPAP